MPAIEDAKTNPRTVFLRRRGETIDSVPGVLRLLPDSGVRGPEGVALRPWRSSVCYNSPVSTVSLQELQRDPDALLDRVEAGEHLVVVRDGREVAELRPVHASPPGPRPFGLCAGAFTVPDDFGAALPEEILRDFEGR
jgi:antitoxin (DNA-binding transcriptional repressor) of toxin-antitoxin stability system